MSLTNTLLKFFDYAMPFSTLTKLMGRLAEAKMGKISAFLIRDFIKAYHINLEECQNPDPASYATFNEFFIRKLRKDARPIADKCLGISPVDGTVGACGTITAGRLIQAKGIDYSFKALMGGDSQDCAPFENGKFATLYLSPSNYHRVHMPIDATLVKTIHIPGRHFPVGKRNTSHMPGLYTANERLVCIFETQDGPFCLIFVGAAIVGSIHTSWSGTVKRRKGLGIKYYEPDQHSFLKGEEIGYFCFGSTVICMWPESFGDFTDNIVEGTPIHMGQPLCR
ncbi:MAG TPA: phosphatidylserine decarboxylase [Succinivibrionaceae bacterium]|nr:phosphatidylserine decarboxylase [Succinivibrionaceae bacterium]